MTTAATASDSATLPTTKSSLDTFGTAQQILNALRIFNQYEEHHIYNIFLSTDSTKEELDNLKLLLYPYQVYTYEPNELEWMLYGPGGVAIIDQWICAHARYFIGTSLSTFTFRIVEERTIMGFSANTTLNCLCSNGILQLYRSNQVMHEELSATSSSLSPSSSASSSSSSFSNCEGLTEWPVIYEKEYTVSSTQSPASTEDEMHLLYNNKRRNKEEL
uniref:GDP-fucose protein O-fucosyltransferase 2 n=1 Tax=Trichobilharzia regenti TaxID=157069 RepID=A0AA85JR45_TRIRE|nr:unnamed protein product [Trichobilharzia regenti]